MELDEQKERARRLLKACDDGDREKAEALIADDFTFQFMEKADSWAVDGEVVSTKLDKQTFLVHGVGAAAQVTQDKLNFSFDLAVSEGPHVMILGQSNAKSLKGKPYNNNYCWYVRFTGDRISELREYCDTKHAHDVLFD